MCYSTALIFTMKQLQVTLLFADFGFYRSAAKLLCFHEVCKELVAAIPMSDVPSYSIQKEDEFRISFALCNKIKRSFDKWTNHCSSKSNNSYPVCKGCCEIDDFTGNELLRVLHDIISKKSEKSYEYQPGDYLCLSKNQTICVALMFTYTKLVIKIPDSACGVKYKYLYERLFADYLVEKHKNTNIENQKLNDRNTVEKLRRKAQNKFPSFLNTKISDFELLPYEYAFLSVLVTIAYRISSRGNPQQFPKCSLKHNVPFAACLKFAFDTSQTGIIAGLCGEDGEKKKEVLWKERADIIDRNAKKLIKK